MALIKYAEGSVLNLVPDLAALRAADALEASNRANAILAEAEARASAVTALSDSITAALAQELVDRAAADAAETAARIVADTAEYDERVQAMQDEQAARILGDATAGSGVADHVNGAFATLKALVDVVNGDNVTDGSFRKVVDDVIGGAPAALDTLKKIADYISVNPDASVADAITRHIDDAVNALKGNVTSAMDTLTEIEDAVTNEVSAREYAITLLTSTLTDAITAEATARTTAVANEATARTTADADEATAREVSEAALEVSLKAYTDTKASQGGSIPKIEYALVTGDNLTLSFAPKSGVNGIMNFGLARYTDDNGVSYDAPLIRDALDASGKTFTLSTDTSGEWDGFSVFVQYVYNL